MDKKLKQKYQADIDIVRRLVNEFDPCSFINAGAPVDEYDCLTQQILSRTYDKRPRQEIRDYVLHEIEHHFGCPDLTILQEPHKTQFYVDLDNMLDKIENQIK
jgi:hypothetical protein